ncbi:miniconductance mechanosensitive channel MscM [Blochmannia endosymbiont of Camponotus (Colobopsis) obliquus]|uniref:miniconductance mechanosensitive channel MscM n=1 Tax=Blochmannia endosymbiont of Camponotus (Colobopsis) obliquus TaxID=1505597 RepID=UPI00061A7A04|nr:miniconductance mechanosensitive channel MscM [Blochmannia endosymbiont of Camponotus (Colobopsis) obliquus]AKC60253.1 putative MscS family protein YjeP [Blochmannia endosymbiont of Camponotus (Colobopsis) obliquus]
MAAIKLIIIYFIGCSTYNIAFATNTTKILQTNNTLIQEPDKKKLKTNHHPQKTITKTTNANFNDTILQNQSYNENIKEYQKTIDNFLILNHQLYEKENNKTNKTLLENIHLLSSTDKLNQQLLKINNQIIDLTTKLQREQDQINCINNTLSTIPQKEKTIKNELNVIEQQILSEISKTSTDKIKLIELEAQHTAKKLKIAELELTKLNINNKQEIFRIQTELIKKKYNQLNKELQTLQKQLLNIHQQNTEIQIENTEFSIEKNKKLTYKINQIILNNKQLYNDLNQQIHHINYIILKQQHIASHITQIKKILNNLLEQAQWLNKSPELGKTLRSQLSKLPKTPKSQLLNNNMAAWRAQRLKYEEQINELNYEALQNKINNNIQLTEEQKKIIYTQLNTKRDLLNILITGCDTQILELTKLKIANEQLKEKTMEIQKTAHRYLFWIADADPISLSYPLQIYQDLQKIINYNSLEQFYNNTIKVIFTNQVTVFALFTSISLLGFQLTSKKKYYAFLIKINDKMKKIKQDRFSFTIHNIFWSIIISIPFPILWITIGYNFRHTWTCPIIVAIGDAVLITTPILWISIITSYFAHPKGLFINHFKWPKSKIKIALKHHTLFRIIILILIITLITFEKYNHREFYNTLSRLCFIILCPILTLITNNLKKSGLMLYLDQNNNNNNIINQSLWNVIICAPMIASLFSCLGYLTTSKILLARLETSVITWIMLIVLYNIIKRWIFIQRCHILIKHIKYQKENKKSLIHKNNNTNNYHLKLNKFPDKTIYNVRIISIQLLRLIKSILAIIVILSIIIIWSELHPAFEFLENITLWNTITTIQEVNKLHKITLKDILISIVILFITTKLVKNIPALLELMLLQHLNLNPGTGYAVITLTKYTLMFLGALIGFSLIGIEWSKIQWLIAALGVGLGFGLQEIFINFISGIMILFEKPIRIGDTVTIRNLTGTITHINTRATTITDLDHKEIIVPNKEFITKQFTNWSLTNTITRIILKIPAPSNIEIEKITNILLKTIKNCSLVLNIPAPEVYLIDLQQGLPLFEIRLYTSKIKYRMPLKHQIHTLILKAYKTHGLILPFPPFQIQQNQFFTTKHDDKSYDK